MTVEEINHRLISAVLKYDRRQQGRPSYNRYALPQYLLRVEEIEKDIRAGAPMRAAILAAFTGTLLNACLRAVNEPRMTLDERDRDSWVYRPASETKRVLK